MKAVYALSLLIVCLSALGSEEDSLRALQELDDSNIEFDFYQQDTTSPTDEDNLIKALELLESSISNTQSVEDSENLIDPLESLSQDQESRDSLLLENIEDEMESNIEQGIEDEIFEILEDEFIDDEFNEDLIDDEFGDVDEVQ